MNKPDSKTEIDTWPFWNPLIITSSVYCIIAFLCSAVSSSNAGPWLLFVVAGLFFSMTQLTSLFAALGSESYWKRLMITQGCLLFFGLSIIGGFSFAFRDSRVSEMAYATMFAIIASSLGGQIMFGFLRFVGNRRFHLEQMPRGPVYGLKDLFAVTTYLAVSLSALNAMFPNDVTDILPIALGTSALMLVATLVYGIPTLTFTISSEDSEAGCVSQLIIVITVGFLVIVPFVAMGATMVIMPLLLLICSSALFTWLPLAFMRERGFVLTKGKQESADGV